MKPKIVRYRDDINAAKADERRKQLLDSLGISPFDGQYELADPQPWNRLSFRPGDVGADYLRLAASFVDLCCRSTDQWPHGETQRRR